MAQLPTPISRLSADTKISDLIDAFPFLIEELGNFNAHYTALRDPAMRDMMAKHATLQIAAERGGVKLADLMNFIANTVQAKTGNALFVDAPSAGVDPDRLKAYREIMIALHKGGDIEEAEKRFATLVKSSAPGEIAEMEQHLIREGMPVSEIKRMCDAHLAVVNPSLKKVELDVLEGHPIHTFAAENRLIEDVIARLKTILKSSTGSLKADSEEWKELKTYVSKLSEVNKHYLRKEHQLFAFLEKKGFSGPSQVMWAVHDDIREQLKQISAACEMDDVKKVARILPTTLNAAHSMIQKEESILFPTALQLLNDSDWTTIKKGEAEIGYMEALSPGDDWEPLTLVQQPKFASDTDEGLLAMNMGELTLEQLNLILVHLPVELSFVDENDEVRFYSNQPHKIFPRTPDAIGRKVQNCHPPKSVHLVNQILSEFRSGKRDTAEFWIELGGMFVYIRYFAIRDKKGKYRGSLEVVQDVRKIRELTGERRLLAEEK